MSFPPSRPAALARALRAAAIISLVLALAAGYAVPASAQDDPQPAQTLLPTLRIVPDGPLSEVKSLALSPNGDRLYAAGYDKVVHVYAIEDGTLRYRPTETIRVPIGGGLDGALNTVAVSPDGRWLAVGGRAVKVGVADVRSGGVLRPTAGMPPEVQLDEGTITLVDLQRGERHHLRGHRGAILCLEFVAGGQTPQLVSASDGLDGMDRISEIRTWQVAGGRVETTGSLTAFDAGGRETPLPAINPAIPPSLVPLPSTPGQPLRIMIGWKDDAFGLRVWEPASSRLTKVALRDALIWLRLSPGSVADPSRPTLTYAAGDAATQQTQIGFLALSPDGRSVRQKAVLKTWPANWLPLGAWVRGPRAFAHVVKPGLRESEIVEIAGGSSRTLATYPQAVLPIAVGNAGSVAVADVARGVHLIGGAANPTDRVRLQSARFAQQTDGRAGLLLTDPGNRTAVFDLKTSQLSGDVAGWTAEADASAARVVGTDGGIVTIQRGDGQTVRLVLPCEGGSEPPRVTARELVDVPGVGSFAAIAAVCANDPTLLLFSLDSGELVRALVAHSGTVTALDASADGRRLVSVADDGTARVWPLDTLADHIGRRGAIRAGASQMSVAHEDEQAGIGPLRLREPFGSLAAGTEIRAASVDGEPLPVDRIGAFYNAIYETAPGSRLTLSLASGGVVSESTLPVGQAIDVQRELLALYVERMPEDGYVPRPGEWIAWSPQGPFDRSGEAMERRLGWHFDDGRPSSPVRFAEVGEYREAFYRPGLAGSLVATGTVPPPPVREAPKVSLLLIGPNGESAAAGGDGERLLPGGQPTELSVRLIGEFPDRLIASVAWSLGEDRGTATLEGESQYLATLPPSAAPREASELAVGVLTGERVPRRFTASVMVRRDVPPPQIALAPIDTRPMAERGQPLRDPAQSVTATVAASDHPVTVTLTHFGPESETVATESRTLAADADRTWSWKVTLPEGTSRIEARATHADAPESLRERETDTAAVTLTHQIDPSTLQPAIEQAAWRLPDGRTLPLAATELPSPRPTLAGRAAIKTPTGSATWSPQNGEAVRVPLRADADGQAGFEIPLTLRPGELAGTLAVADAEGRAVSQPIRTAWLPPAPSVEADDPIATSSGGGEAEGWSGTLIDGLHEPALTLTGVTVGSVDGGETAFGLLLDGEPAEVEIAADGRRLTATLPIPPGRHRIQWTSAGSWGRRWTSGDPIAVARVRPPQVASDLTIGHDDPTAYSASVAATVISPDAAVRIEESVIQVNGRRVPTDGAAVEPLGEGRYRLTVPNVPLPQIGANVIAVRPGGPLGSDAEAGGAVLMASAASTATVVRERPPAKPPEIGSIEAADTVGEPVVGVSFSVRAERPLVRVEIMVQSADGAGGSRTIAVPAAQLAAIATDDAGRTPGRLAANGRLGGQVPLGAGRNQITVTATDADGIGGSRTVDVTYAPRPLIEGQLSVDRQSLPTDSQSDVRPANFVGRDRSLGVVDSPNLRLQGYFRVRDDEIDRGTNARVWVNGFRQSDFAMRPVDGDSQQADFAGTIVLNRKANNQIRIEPPPGLPKDIGFRGDFTIDCRNPSTEQRVYVILLGLNSEDTDAGREALKQRAVASFAAEFPDQAGMIRTALGDLDRDTVSTLVGRDVDRDVFRRKIALIERRVTRDRKQRTGGLLSPVVLVYYEGREWKSQRGDEFLLEMQATVDGPWRRDSRMLGSRDIGRELQRLGGAHLLFLDVVAGEPDRPLQERWDSDEYLGLFRIVRSERPASEPLLSLFGEASTQAERLGDVGRALLSRFETLNAAAADIQIEGPLAEMRLVPR